MIGQPLAALDGLRVLVVEDEAMVAMMAEDFLAELHCVVVGVAGSVRQALKLLDDVGTIGAAVLDINLGGEQVFPVADVLTARRIPFVFASGYGPGGSKDRYPGSETLAKPYGLEPLGRALANCLFPPPDTQG